MGRKFTGGKLLVASGNAGKVREIRELLLPFAVEVFSAADFGVTEPEETGSSFIENAELKAAYYGQAANMPALADDSGLCVNCLGGMPGIYSARWAGENKDFSAAIVRLEREAASHKDKTAYFACALSLYWPQDGHIESFEGKVEGSLAFPPLGDKGFGYDPVFIPDGYGVTFAQMQPEEKHKISHRAKAFEKLIRECF